MAGTRTIWRQEPQGLVRYTYDADGKLIARYALQSETQQESQIKGSTKKPHYRHKSKNIVKWGDFAFSVTPKDITGVKDMALSGSCETEEKESGKQKYEKYKSAKPIEFTMKVILNSYLTSDVKEKTVKLIKASTKGESNYLYIGNEKLFTPRFMLTAAKTGKVTLAAGNTWIAAEIDLTFKQSTKNDGTKKSSSGKKKSGGGSKKKSTKRGGTKGGYSDGGKIHGALPKIKDAVGKQKEAKRQSHHDEIRSKNKKTIQPTSPGRRMSGATQ